MKIRNLAKRLFCTAAAAVTVVMMSGLNVFAIETEPSKLSFDSAADWVDGVQGNNCWYYQYTLDSKYTKYTNGSWTTKNNTKGFYGMNSSGTVVDNFYVTQNGMHPGIGEKSKPARVWVAPYSGRVRVYSNGNVRKASKWGGQTVVANIVHTNSKQKDEKLLWTANILSGNVIGEGNNYSFDVDVTKGDRIYFEISCASQSNAGVIWQTKLDYLQASYFSVNGAEVSSTEDLTSGSMISCSFYDGGVINEASRLFLAVYDEKGRMRKISDVSSKDFTDNDNRRVDLSVILPESSGAYSGWSIKLIGVTASPNEYWPVDVADTVCFK